jgi:chromosome segregation ATPase
MKSEDAFEKSVNEKKIPVLTLDNQWHRLFAKVIDVNEIEELQNDLNALIKKQGKFNTELKDVKKIKSKLMNEIVEVRDDEELSVEDKDKKLDEKTRLINECNDKIEEYEDGLLDLPREIDQTNRKLMLVTMSSCYDELNKNKNEIDEISNWIAEIRVELKKKLLRKQKKEFLNREMYSYMHNIFGAEVVELFDLQFDIDELEKDNKKEKN